MASSAIKTICILFSALTVATIASASATNIYLGQSASGAANGSDCNDTYPYTFFNNGGNWGSGSNQIGPGTVVHLCGTWNGAPGQQWLVAQGSGTNGNPVTIKFESSTILQAPYHSAGGGINVSGRSYITIDGGTNGLIRNTLNGSQGGSCPGGACNSKNDSNLIVALSATAFELKNLNCSDVYDHTVFNDDSGFNQEMMACVQVSGNNVKVDSNVIHDAGLGVKSTYSGGNDNYQIYGNNISRVGWALYCAGDSNNLPTFSFHDNHVHDIANWNTDNDSVHQNGIHCFNGSGGGIDNFYLYNNLFDGDQGNCCMTAWVYMEAMTQSNPWSNGPGLHAWNNIFINDLNLGNGQLSVAGGSANEVYNNTFLVADPNPNRNGACLGAGYAKSSLSFRNNAFSGCQSILALDSALTISAASNNIYANIPSSGNPIFSWVGVGRGGTSTLSDWQALCQCDTGSVFNASASLGTNAAGVPQSGFLGLGKATALTAIATGNLASLLSDTSAGGTRIPLLRAGTWDAGAYQTSGNATRPMPPTNVSVSLQ